MKFKIGDKVKIRKNVTLEEIANNWFNGCQRDTFIFLKDYFYSPTYDSVFIIRDVDCNNCVKISLVDSDWVNGVIFEKVEEILDDKEKEYLSSVIKPYRNKVIYIKKLYCNTHEYIRIELEDDFASLPMFEKGTMYKNMKVNKEYSLEELGLNE